MAFPALRNRMASTGSAYSPYQHRLNGQDMSINNRSRLIPCKLTCVNVRSAYLRNALLVGDLTRTELCMGDGLQHLARRRVAPVATRLELYGAMRMAARSVHAYAARFK